MLPPAGMALLRALRDPGGARADDLHRLAREALAGATTIPRWSRVVPAASILIPLALMTVVFGTIAGRPLMVGLSSQDLALFNTLVTIDALERAGVAATQPRRDALEVYLARRYEGLAARAASFGGFLAPYRSLAEDIARRHPLRPAGELESAITQIGRDELDALNGPPRLPVPTPMVLLLLALPLVAAIGIVVVVMAVVLRGGVLWTLLRCVVVDESGERVTRVRAGARALVAWAPAFALVPMRHQVVRAAMAGDMDSWTIVGMLLMALIAIGGASAFAVPARGVQERVSNTWITPA